MWPYVTVNGIDLLCYVAMGMVVSRQLSVHRSDAISYCKNAQMSL